MKQSSSPESAPRADAVDNSDSEKAPLSGPGEARRRFLIDTGVLATGLAATPCLGAASDAATEVRTAPSARGVTTSVRLDVNGRTYDLRIDPRVTLLDALREHLGLTGTKKGCDRGQCGACTVLVNGRRINSCLALAVAHGGERIVTIEGLGSPAALHPVQQAFCDHEAFQCGYCTPGQICSAVALLDEARTGAVSAATPDVRGMTPVALTDDEIRERMSGNLCRCGAYVNIVAAVRAAARGST